MNAKAFKSIKNFQDAYLAAKAACETDKGLGATARLVTAKVDYLNECAAHARCMTVNCYGWVYEDNNGDHHKECETCHFM